MDDVTDRVWRLYLAGAAHSFTVGHNPIFRTLLARPTAQGVSALPLTRDDLFAK